MDRDRTPPVARLLNLAAGSARRSVERQPGDPETGPDRVRIGHVGRGATVLPPFRWMPRNDALAVGNPCRVVRELPTG